MLDRFFAGDQNALDREQYDLKNITLADMRSSMLVSLRKPVQADQGDATNQIRHRRTGASTADKDRDAIFDLETARNNNQVLHTHD